MRTESHSQGAIMTAPLDGIRVLDFTSYIAGPYAGMMLADLGADVIKVEPPDGDPFRELPGFFGWNRGKRSVSIDLKDAAGREIVHRLAQVADVSIENMRPGVSARLGIDYTTLYAINPRIIGCSITGFGSDGPWRDRPGFDPLLQAMGGVMHLQGFGGPPQYVRIALTDYYAAALSAQAVLAALFVRERTGKGQRVETSLLQSVLALQSGNVVEFSGKESVFRDNPTYRLYRASDAKWFFLACGNQTFWTRLCGVLGHPGMAKDPRFGSWLLRLDHASELIPLLEKTFSGRTCDEWLRVLSEHDIPCAPVMPLEEFLKHPAVQHLDMTAHYHHPVVGPLTLMGQPIRFSETPATPGPPPPLLGQHTVEILEQIGYSANGIQDLKARGIIRTT